MPTTEKKKVVAALSDLMFTVKIQEAAKRANLPIEFVKTGEDLLEKAKEQPKLIILDLNCASIHAVELIRKMKSDPDLKKIYLIAFLSHVQGELKQSAHEAGCDMVLARSAFSQNIVQILQRHSGVVV
ncbi:MAG: response regulator [Acidimicrobiia bacterium]|nr:response regulator [Acidimicrobiia bacterium]